VDLLVIFLLSLFKTHEIDSKDAKEQLKEWIFENVDTFIHEFLTFANSPYDMDAYDKAVRYDYSNAKTINNQKYYQRKLQ